MKKISILLPYKENFSPKYAGAVSLLVNDTNALSKFKNGITVFGSTEYKEKFHGNYQNINFRKFFFESSNIKYTEKFLEYYKKYNYDLVEIHNRPAVFNHIAKQQDKIKIVFYFHNDPLTLRGSISAKQRNYIFERATHLVFVSEWTKERFFKNTNLNMNDPKISVIYPSVNKKNYNKKKKKIILFVGRLNYAKGYDIFCDAIVRILEKYPAWKSYVIGDEPRAKIQVDHPRLSKLGFLEHKKILQHYSEASIAVGCSKWQEPMGRIGFEASSRGCATIVSDRGGLPETVTNGIVLNDVSSDSVFNAIDNFIKNPNYRKKISKLAYDNFKNDLNLTVKKIDRIRNNCLNGSSLNGSLNLKNKIFQKKKRLRILHITNFSERHDGRLFFVSIGQKLSSGFVKLGHSVLNFSDRDLVRTSRFYNLNSRALLNKKLINTVQNYNPDLIVLGHADLIYKDTLEKIKIFNKNIIISQWFEDPLIKNGPDYEKNRDKVIEKLEFIDHTFVTTNPDVLDFKGKNNFFHFFPIPVDTSVERLKAFENPKPIYDVFFAMSHGVNRGVLKLGKLDGREDFINELILKNPGLKFDIYGLNGRQPIWAENFFNTIYKSKMALNLSRGEPKKYYSSNRIASLLGNGLLTFIDKKTKFGDFFNDDEIIFYNNIHDLSEKLDRYAVDDKQRIKIAKKGWLKYHKHFNSQEIANYMIDRSFNFNNKKVIWEK